MSPAVLASPNAPATSTTLGVSLGADSWRRLKRDRWARASLGVIVLYLLVALGTETGLLCPGYDQAYYRADNSYLAQQPPGAYEAWNEQGEKVRSFFLLGTDHLGRDVFSRVLHGTGTAIKVGIITSLIAIPIGVLLGGMAGFFGGFIDEIIVWFYSSVASVPGLLLILAFTMVLGKGIFAVYVSIGLTTWVALCRIIRGEFIKHKHREYVMAAAALGAGNFRQIFVHILPNVFHLVIINFSLRFVYAVKTEVILSYIGVGVQKEPSWGQMISYAQQELIQGYWWQFLGASVAMFFLLMAFNIFGDSLRDAMDPKLRDYS